MSCPYAGATAADLSRQVYAVPDALNPPAPQDASFFMNGAALVYFIAPPAGSRCAYTDPFVRAALHAPQSKNWTQSFE